MITYSDPWNTSYTHNALTAKRRWKLHFEGQEQVSTWDQRTDRKLASNGATQSPLT